MSLQGLVGCGKTVLATKLAHDVRENFPDGVLWIRANEEFIEEDLRRSAEVFGIDEDFNKLEAIDQKINFLKTKLSRKRMLVILDGLDQDDYIQDFANDIDGFHITNKEQNNFKGKFWLKAEKHG